MDDLTNEYLANDIKVLGEMARVMDQVAEAGKSLNMGRWFENPKTVDLNQPIHDCNTPACVAGWCSLDPVIKGMAEHLLLDYPYYVISADDMAGSVADLIIDENNQGAVIAHNSKSRQIYARRSGLFTEEELGSFKHLTSDTPSPADAAEFIKALRDKLKEQQAQNEGV